MLSVGTYWNKKEWKENFQTVSLTGEAILPSKIYQTTKDNKLRQFLFKILHKIIVTRKELKKFNIATDDHCNFCFRTDSIIHTFLECGVYFSILKYTCTIHRVHGLTISEYSNIYLHVTRLYSCGVLVTTYYQITSRSILLLSGCKGRINKFD